MLLRFGAKDLMGCGCSISCTKEGTLRIGPKLPEPPPRKPEPPPREPEPDPPWMQPGQDTDKWERSFEQLPPEVSRNEAFARITNLMTRSGATHEEVTQALVDTSWHAGQAMVALDRLELERPWPRSCALSRGFDSRVEALAPKYWSNQELTDGQPLICDASPAFQVQVQELLRGTFKPVATKDRKGVMPDALSLVKCERIENPQVWLRYHHAKLHVATNRPKGVRPVQDLDGDPEHGHIKTEQRLSEEFAERTEASINEFYLWHGTSQEGAASIAAEGFKVNLAGAASGTMFGPGAYFAECSSKSDEYAKEWGDSGIFALLLCRVTCGELFRTTQPRLTDIRKALLGGSYDTVLGDREAARGTYREFVVYDEALIYPEYIVQYRRGGSGAAE